MDIYETEEEQIEKIKECVRQYGPTVLISILIVLIGSFAWRYWQGHEELIRAKASIGYESMMTSFLREDASSAQIQGKELIKLYPKTPYAQLASLTLARLAVDRNDLSTAKNRLNWVIRHARAKSLRQIARNRLAQVLIYQKQYNEALNLLQIVDDPGYQGAIDALKGDIYEGLGNIDAARDAYKKALALLPKDAANWPLVEMKLNDIAKVQQESVKA